MEMGMGIPEFFRGRSVFITGGSGFMGKVLVEKLLRSCPDLDNIYVLMRPKRGQQVAGRYSDLLDCKIFEWLKENRKHQLNKIVAVAGDITKPGLGLSPEDQEMLVREVSVVFHAAATVKFDEVIRLSVALNLLGTKSLLQLCEKMDKLVSVVHVSTAYCNCNLNDDIYEKLYPAPADPEQVIQMVQLLDDHVLDCITPLLLKDRPNTYTFTKALAEHVVYEKSGRLPIAIFRPSIVTSAIEEPLPGWVDNLNGPTGVLAGVGKGVLRSVMCHRDAIADFIPVDRAINCMIAIAWATAVTRPNNIVIYNCTTGASSPLYWRDMEQFGLEFILKYPSREILWYPGGSFKSSPTLNDLHTLAVQTLPAYLHDGLSRLTGRKPIMVRIQEKLQKALETTQFFTTKDFKFRNDNVVELYKTLSPEDQKTFCFDLSNIDWRKYIETYVLGTRKFILKEDPATIPESRVNLKKMYVLHRGTQLLMFIFIFWGFLMRSSTARFTFYQMLSAVSKMMTALSKTFASVER
uniref:Fatty acyl-CoA reductase n=1 Tax=Adelphocoris suturalis TaxID=323751 RepID=A0A1Z3FT38_9HEMI|nr:fatty acyl-CoA reductase [Adelphocoris suturalis]